MPLRRGAVLFSVFALLIPPAVSAQPLAPELLHGLRWRLIGPHRGGRVTAVAGIAGDPKTYYMGTPNGGVWKTTNAGRTWSPIFDDTHVASIGDLVVAPSNPSVIYVATGEQSVGNGVWKSTDAGVTWSNIGLRQSRLILSVLVALGGIWLAYRIYLEREGLADQIAARWKGLYELIYNKYYMDQVYDSLFVNRTTDLATALGDFDLGVVDGLGVDGSATATRFSSRVSMWWDKWIVDGLVNLSGAIVRFSSYPVRMLQTGLVQSYALVILFGVLLLLVVYLGWPAVAYVRSLLHWA
jgi:hypothetical protein